MLKRAVLFAVVFVAARSLGGQTLSPLHQFLSSNSMLNRPQVFRDLQTNIAADFGKVKPGLRIDILYEKMSKIRPELLNLILPRLVAGPSDDFITFVFQQDTLAVPFPDVTFAQALDAVELAMAGQLSELIALGLESFHHETRDAMIAALLLAFDQAGVTRGMSFVRTPDYTANLARATAGILRHELENTIKQANPQLYEKLIGASLKQEIEKTFAEVIESVRAMLVQAFDRAEHEIANVLSEFSKWLVAGNTGLAVSEGGRGAFAGGVLVSLVFGSSWQAGVYANAQLSSPDSAMPKQSLLGIQARYARDRLQFDVLAARLFGFRKLKAVEAREIGLGVSCRASRRLIVGLAYFNLFVRRLPAIQTFGATFKGTSANSPALLLGAELQRGRTARPLVQISFPFTVK